jgi:hypothetical protein
MDVIRDAVERFREVDDRDEHGAQTLDAARDLADAVEGYLGSSNGARWTVLEIGPGSVN